MNSAINNNSIKLKDVTAVILVADNDFGRCAVATQLPRALWPVGDKTVLQRLVDQIFCQGLKKFVICSTHSSVRLGKSLEIPKDADVRFHEEIFPRGTAGSVQDACYIAGTELIIAFHAEMISPPDVDFMLREHQSGGNDMTIIFNPQVKTDYVVTDTAQVYICNKKIMESIPAKGYCDIKETLVPQLLKDGRNIHAVEMPENAGDFRNWQQYLSAISNHIISTDTDKVIVDTNASVDSSARIIGSVQICSGAEIAKDVLIFGPAVIGPNVIIAEGTAVSKSIIWDRAQIGAGCFVQNSLISKEAVLLSNKTLEHSLWAQRPGVTAKLTSSLSKASTAISGHITALINDVQLQGRYIKWFGGIMIFAIFMWSYWNNVIADLWTIWLQSDEYSSGILVPAIAACLVWTRRYKIAECKISPSLWGCIIFISAQLLRFFGLLFMYASAERLSMVVTIAAIIILMFGWTVFARLSTILLFLCLMLPLPNSFANSITLPLQQWATSSAVFCLEALGFNLIREGNVINLDGITVAVAEACNGLRMLTSFFIISGMVAMIINRNWIYKLIIVASSIPIALLCNTIRLTATSIAFTQIDSRKWEMFFHDFGGFAMMPIALMLVVLELKLLSNIFMEPETVQDQIITRKMQQ